MHSAQTSAVLAILSMIESGMREIRTLLGATATQTMPPNVGQMAVEPMRAYTPEGTLSEEEEVTLERMMEKHRLDLLAAAGNMADKFYQEDAPDKFMDPQFFDEDILG